jgi:hypothetical protein
VLVVGILIWQLVGIVSLAVLGHNLSQHHSPQLERVMLTILAGGMAHYRQQLVRQIQEIFVFTMETYAATQLYQ